MGPQKFESISKGSTLSTITTKAAEDFQRRIAGAKMQKGNVSGSAAGSSGGDIGNQIKVLEKENKDKRMSKLREKSRDQLTNSAAKKVLPLSKAVKKP